MVCFMDMQLSGLPDRALMEMDNGGAKNVKRLMKIAEEVFSNKSMEHLPFGGRRNLSVTNEERLDWFADRLVEEHQRRALRKNLTVSFKKADSIPRAQSIPRAHSIFRAHSIPRAEKS